MPHRPRTRAMSRTLVRTVAVVGAVCTTTALAACTGGVTAARTPGASASASSSSAAAPVTPAATPSPSSSGSAAEQRYVTAVQQLGPDLAALPSRTVITLGRQVCAGFRSGEDSGRIADVLGRSTAAPGLSATDVAFLLGGAVAVLCPQYRDRLDQDG